MKTIAFDIDGTLTLPGFDLWFLVTKSLAHCEQTFSNAVDEWRSGYTGLGFLESSKSMMETGLKLSQAEAEVVYRTAFQQTVRLQRDNQFIRHEAIKALKQHIGNSCHVILSTANYQEAGLGFADALVYLELLSETDRRALEIQGSFVNYEHQIVEHINVGVNKVSRIPYLDVAYGDDPLGNDSGLAEESELFYLVDSEKNADLSGFNRVYW